MTDLEARARALRAKALSGPLNLMTPWKDTTKRARMFWLGKAQAEINAAADGDASTPQNDPAKFALAKLER